MKLERFKNKKPQKIGIIVFTVVCILLIAGVFLYTSFASFETNETFNIINGEVADPGDIYFVYYVDEQITREVPKQNTGYILDEEKSNCTNGVVPKWNHSTWEFEGDYTNYVPSNMSQTKCTLYFKKTKKIESILGELEVYEYTPDFTKSACDDETCESHEKGIYETTDADGTTYYYRGSVENNYVLFANRYWRIIRINGDGTIRMIYDGTEAHDNGESSTDRQAGTTRFNEGVNNNMNVGYMYTNGETHGTGTSSAIKTVNDNFYTSVLSSYSQHIDTNAGFCGDRSTLNLQNGVGTGQTITYYKGYLRMVISSPDLTCENTSDLYTVSSSNKGNKALSYPVGLITLDEVLFSGSGGGVFDGDSNKRPTSPNSYLTTGNNFWTMTPAGGYFAHGYSVWNLHVFATTPSGALDDKGSYDTAGLRPVINIRSDVTINGSGTKGDPYTLSVE